MKSTTDKRVEHAAAGHARTAIARKPPRFLELIPPNPGIDFVKLSPPMAILSAILILLAGASWFARGGFNYGIDFVGGTVIQVRYPNAVAVGDVRAALARPGLRNVTVQDVGGASKEFQIRVQGDQTESGGAISDEVKTGLREKFGEGSFDVLRVESVGPKVGSELWRSAILAVVFATLMMGIYIAFRFDMAFGAGAAVALFHDVIITMGALLITNMEFDLSTVAALLTVVGFSVNDTVIISDRIREDTRKLRKESYEAVVNTAINETLSRTIITSGTAILTTVALFVLGGPVIHSFAFALLVGFTVGTYSSIFVATPIVLAVERRRRKR
jgi:preprotein translocase subunit SecF